MFRTSTCPSSVGQIVLSQHLLSPLWMLWWYNLYSWRWACWCSKHVEDCNV